MLTKVSTAISSRKRVVVDRITHLTEVEVAVAHSSVEQPTTTKNDVQSDAPVEAETTQVNPDIPVAVPTKQRKPVDDNRGNLFLPDIPAEPQTPSIPLATSTDRCEERKRRDAKIRCYRCEGYTPHTVRPCDYPEYAADWIAYVCDKCGSKAYGRKDDDERIDGN